MGKCGCVGSLLPVSTQLSGRPVHGNTRAALDTTTPQINEASHILLWFDNQSQNITGEMCPKYHGKCVHWVGLNYCKSILPRKIESQLVFSFSLYFDASSGSFGILAEMLVAWRLRWWKIAIWVAQKNYICEIRKFLEFYACAASPVSSQT